MLRHTSQIKGYAIGASDGPIGSIADLLFDDQTWRVRWLVVDIGHILPGRQVLLPPSALGAISHIARQFSVRLTVEEVRNAPDIATDAPVSRQMESDLYDYYGWSPYWTSGFYMGGYGYGGALMGAPWTAGSPGPRHKEADGALGDAHLRSVNAITGYHLHARDGEIGHVADVLVEDGDWTVHYLVADTRNWWPGQKVLVSPRSVERVSWTDRLVDLSITRQQVRESPAYDPTATVDRAYENRFHDYYGHLPRAEPVN